LLVRIYPFLQSEAPLGYDTGIYKRTIEDYQVNLPRFYSSLEYTKNEPIGLYLITNITSLVGFNSDQILSFIYILINLFLALALYLVVKEFFDKETAFCSLFLFAISITQFQAYRFVYYKNILALFLMLISLYLLKKKSYWIIPVAGFMGGVHHMTFYLFGLVLLAVFIFNKKHRKYHFISGLGILAVCLSLYVHNFNSLFNLLPAVSPLAKFSIKEMAGGRFFDLNVYQYWAVFYIPLAVLGLIYLIQKRKFSYLFFYFLFNFIIVYFIPRTIKLIFNKVMSIPVKLK